MLDHAESPYDRQTQTQFLGGKVSWKNFADF